VDTNRTPLHQPRPFSCPLFCRGRHETIFRIRNSPPSYSPRHRALIPPPCLLPQEAVRQGRKGESARPFKSTSFFFSSTSTPSYDSRLRVVYVGVHSDNNSDFKIDCTGGSFQRQSLKGNFSATLRSSLRQWARLSEVLFFPSFLPFTIECETANTL